MAELDHKLRAATLMESLIAMVIIVVCMGIATMIYSNVLDSDNERAQLRALLLLNKEAGQIKNEKKFVDSEKQAGDWTIKTTIEHYDQSEDLYKLSLKITDGSGKVIAVRNELIFTE